MLARSATNCDNEILRTELILSPSVCRGGHGILVGEFDGVLVGKRGFSVDIVDSEFAHLRDIAEIYLLNVALDMVPELEPVMRLIARVTPPEAR